MPDQTIIQPDAIGGRAAELLAQDGEASILGTTSQGCFLKTTRSGVIFLTSARFRGPLTINLPGDDLLERCSTGMHVLVAGGSLRFPDGGFSIPAAGIPVWQPLPKADKVLDYDARFAGLKTFARAILKAKPGVGLGGLLPGLLELDAPGLPAALSPIDLACVRQVQEHLRRKDAGGLAGLLAEKLGAGQGLTPSADDFATGLLLALNRYPDHFWPDSTRRTLNQQVVDSAFECTTSLSANIIACAAQGWADERLVDGLDFLVSGEARSPQVLANLLGWGNSSGVDAFVGMCAVVG